MGTGKFTLKLVVVIISAHASDFSVGGTPPSGFREMRYVFADRYARVIQLKRSKKSHLSALWTSLPGVSPATGSNNR